MGEGWGREGSIILGKRRQRLSPGLSKVKRRQTKPENLEKMSLKIRNHLFWGKSSYRGKEGMPKAQGRSGHPQSDQWVQLLRVSSVGLARRVLGFSLGQRLADRGVLQLQPWTDYLPIPTFASAIHTLPIKAEYNQPLPLVSLECRKGLSSEGLKCKQFLY